MNERPAIRAARPDDAPRLKELGALGWETTYADFLRPENRARYLVSPFWSLERLRAVIADPASAAFVAERAGQVAGFANDEPHDAGRVELTRLYVDSAVRRGGLGRALLDAGLGWARARGARSMLVNVFADNQIGRAFYAQAGFQLVELCPVVIGGQTVGDAWYEIAL